MGSWHGKRWLMVMRPSHRMTQLLASPIRCKDAREWKEKLTAWSLNVAEYEHQFKVIDEAKR